MAVALYPVLVYLAFLVVYGLVFDTALSQGVTVAGQWQFLPAKALQERPFQSLLYLHSRPPLANALYALDLHLGLRGRTLVLWNAACGALLFYFLFRLIHRLAGGSRLAFAVFPLALALLSLDLVVFLGDPLYTFSTASLLLGLVWFALEFLRDGRTGTLIGFIILAWLVSLLRETYGAIFLALIVTLFVARRGARGLWGLASVVPLLAWCMKNLLVFGFFGSGTLLGQALFLNAGPSPYLPDDARHGGKWQQIESDAARDDPRFAPLFIGIMHRPSDYEARGFHFTPNPKFAAIPALARDEGGWWSASNKNAYEYIELSAAFLRLSLRLIRQDPMNYLANCWTGFRLFLKPSWTYLQTVTRWHNTHPHVFRVYRLPPIDRRSVEQRGVYVSEGYDLFPIAYAVVLVGLLVLLVSPIARPRRSETLLFFLLLGVGSAGAFMVSNVESMRYKFEIEPFVYAIFFGWLTRAVSARRGSAGAPPRRCRVVEATDAQGMRSRCW
jgi:hypothetical protein